MTSDSAPARPPRAPDPTDRLTLPALAARGGVGGVLMGLANLVPGISGGTMLLAAGVYPAFIAAIADITTLRFNRRSLTVLGVIAGAAVLAILLLAGTMRMLVIEHRWAMYSLFIGLTLGGVPLVRRLAGAPTRALRVAAVISFLLMSLMAIGGTGASSHQGGTLMLMVAGLAGASAMILPGVSGSYLLVLLGQYEPILGAIDMLKEGLLGVDGGGFDPGLVIGSMEVVIPVGIGVLVGVVAVSNLLKWLLERYEKATLGALLGLLVGAVVGLYPFQEAVRPVPGDVHEGIVLDEEAIMEMEREEWRLRPFTPSAVQVAGGLGLILIGFGATMAVDHIGRDRSRPDRTEDVS